MRCRSVCYHQSDYKVHPRPSYIGQERIDLVDAPLRLVYRLREEGLAVKRTR
jgi:hypothetical protein